MAPVSYRPLSYNSDTNLYHLSINHCSAMADSYRCCRNKHVLYDPFRTSALQLYINRCITQIPSNLSPKRECSPNGVRRLYTRRTRSISCQVCLLSRFSFNSGNCRSFKTVQGDIITHIVPRESLSTARNKCISRRL